MNYNRGKFDKKHLSKMAIRNFTRVINLSIAAWFPIESSERSAVVERERERERERDNVNWEGGQLKLPLGPQNKTNRAKFIFL